MGAPQAAHSPSRSNVPGNMTVPVPALTHVRLSVGPSSHTRPLAGTLVNMYPERPCMERRARQTNATQVAGDSARGRIVELPAPSGLIPKRSRLSNPKGGHQPLVAAAMGQALSYQPRLSCRGVPGETQRSASYEAAQRSFVRLPVGCGGSAGIVAHAAAMRAESPGYVQER